MKKKKWGRRTDPMKNWPMQEDGTPVPPAFLSHESELSLDATVTISMLNAYGVPVMKNYPLDGSFGEVVMGMSGFGSQLFVPQTMLEMAQDLIRGDARIIEEDIPDQPDESGKE